MRIFISIIRIIVGLLFIFSGLVKANDPLGLSYKMQEYFEIWGFTRFNDQTIWMSVLMNAFEIIAGFALLIGWKPKLVNGLLFILILFFTFLTGYTYVTGKPVNCGCFGDCLPITSLTSFLKDLLLTLLILILIAGRRYIIPVAGKRVLSLLMIVITVFSFGLQWYTLRYLPLVDCLPFKKGNSIPEQMLMPKGAVTDSFAIVFVYSREGKQYEFSPAQLPADLASYEYVSRRDKLIRAGNAIPPIKGFSLSGVTGVDSTDIVLTQPRALLLFCENFKDPVSSWAADFAGLYEQARSGNIPVYAISNTAETAKRLFAPFVFRDIQVLSCDNTAIRTAARAMPTVYLLEQGRVIEKQSVHRLDKISSRLKSAGSSTINP